MFHSFTWLSFYFRQKSYSEILFHTWKSVLYTRDEDGNSGTETCILSVCMLTEAETSLYYVNLSITVLLLPQIPTYVRI